MKMKTYEKILNENIVTISNNNDSVIGELLTIVLKEFFKTSKFYFSREEGLEKTLEEYIKKYISITLNEITIGAEEELENSEATKDNTFIIDISYQSGIHNRDTYEEGTSIATVTIESTFSEEEQKVQA